MASQRLRSFAAQIDAAKKLTMQGPARQKELSQLSQDSLQEGRAINRAAIGHDIADRTLVNGQPARAEDIKPGGVVVHLFAVHHAAIDFAYETLARLSPIDSGHYKNSHQMLVNDVPVDPPVEIGMDDVVTFVNPAAYARRLERGWSDQAPDGIYEVATQIVRRRFGGIVTTAFRYVALSGGEVARGKAGNNPNIRYPALVIAPKGTRVRKYL